VGQVVEEEHDKMIKMGMWETITQAEVPKDTTWAMKKKSSGSFRARVNARGLTLFLLPF